MMNEHKDRYESPLTKRYASKEMSLLFSDTTKYSMWRHMWYTLATVQQELGIAITHEQLEELKKNRTNLNLDRAHYYEQLYHHDVVAHLHAYAEQCPNARPIMHIGATSCLITDNAEHIIMRDALKLIAYRLHAVIQQLAAQAERYKEVMCVSFTHFQPAQPTTVGKRMCLWLHDLYLDVITINHYLSCWPLLGIKGATGTQASFLELFQGNHAQVQELENRFVRALGFAHVVPIAGQTYTRKYDVYVLDLLKHIAISAHKMATDIRLLAHLQEVEEPFGKQQVGSSAMPYKRNPIKSERICSLARFVISLAENPAYTAATQWFERTLDDSANRRLCIAEAFLATDALLLLAHDSMKDLIVNEQVIEHRLQQELPFMITEQILIAATAKGTDRQIIHEQLRHHSHEVTAALKLRVTDNTLLDRIAEDPLIPLDREELNTIMHSAALSGRSSQQVTDFLAQYIAPLQATPPDCNLFSLRNMYGNYQQKDTSYRTTNL